MKDICLDEGTIQAFLDGELNEARMDAATRHIALCDDCAMILSAAEEESAFAFAALDGDMNTLVPTQRLWSKINDSITEERRQNSFWNSVSVFLTNLSRPSVAAFASLVIVAGLFAVLLTSRPLPTDGDVAVNHGNFNVVKTTGDNVQRNPVPSAEPNAPAEPVENPPAAEPQIEVVDSQPSRNEEFKAVKTGYRPSPKPSAENRKPAADIVVPQYLPGEETYIRTIANLSETVNYQKDTAMKPSTRFAYEKDLAMINDAIGKMKEEVKKNPKNEAAKDILFASYQNKINLLNSVNERTELVASIR